MGNWVYESYHATTGVQLHSSLPFRDESWSWIVRGNGSFSGKITIPQDPQAREQIREATEKKVAAIYVRDRSNSSWPWGGPVLSRQWDPDNRVITVTAVDWRTWFFWVFLAPLENLTGDVLYSWTQVDQLQIARDICNLVTAGGSPAGRPTILAADTIMSGILRDLNVQGLSFKRPGDLLNTMSNRDRGFEWGIDIRADAFNRPAPHFSTYYPQQGASVQGLLLKATPDGANLLKYGPVDENGADQRERQWTTGAGQPPDIPFAQDTDPNIGGVLMREDVSNYSSVTERTTLASHARAERRFYSQGTNTLAVEVSLDNPDVSSYAIGDRGRLLIQDDWTDWDLPAVRIVEKKVDPQNLKASLTLDLADYTLPEVDTGGTV
jgi:hypothetical protein